MSWPVEFDLSRISLSTNRVDAADGDRQLATVREILSRLKRQPGLVLADEVGMGKTFVALAVAVAAALTDRGRRPVVVMVPAALRAKWPADWEVFSKLCLLRDEDRKILAKPAESALDFFRLLDDPPAKRARIVFLSHGAFYAGLDDPWVKLAIIKRALHGIHLGDRRQALPRFISALLRTKSSFDDPGLYVKLLAQPFERWKQLINDHSHREKDRLDDDPIPDAARRALERAQLDLVELQACLRTLPVRESANIDDRLTAARRTLNAAMKMIWPQALASARFRSPLLILDEAHHLKNPATRLASLFVQPDTEERDQIAGALDGGFERMLFLTATPFQLGHHEILSVLDRFRGIDWRSLPSMTPEAFATTQNELRKGLDDAQVAATDFDQRWKDVRSGDLLHAGDAAVAEPSAGDPGRGVFRQQDDGTLPPRLEPVAAAHKRARDALKEAETALKPWVIRHLRRRTLPGTDKRRRIRFSGSGLRSVVEADVTGLPISDQAVLPFLLAARCQALVSHRAARGASSRATFAEGLASSYEAFLDTRRTGEDAALKLDEEEARSDDVRDARLDRYLDRLTAALPSPEAFARHPKMDALVARVVDLWAAGEKVVVFCHYRMTGRAIVRHLSAAIERHVWGQAATRLGCPEGEAHEKLRLIGEAFDDGRPLQRLLHDHVEESLSAAQLDDGQRDIVHDIVRRFVRTPLFLVRHLDLGDEDRAHALGVALGKLDESHLGLRKQIQAFVEFVAKRCQKDERAEYLAALDKIHPGLRGERPVDGETGVGDQKLLPNIRLANGGVSPESRRRLLLAFNTPFFPEILVASSVMAEGVDLHLNCRHLIHYDLSWNPSTIEQRTGRVDRMGAKAEVVKEAINVFLPFVAATQDEKMYRVVTDRERWFQVVMGEDYRIDEAHTDALAKRVPLPESIAAELAFRLEV